MRPFFLITLLFLTSCASGPDTVQPITVQDKVATAAERAACARSGGIIERAGMLGYERCTYRYSDGKAVCSDSSDCEGQCRAMGDFTNQSQNNEQPVTGQCQIDDNPFGCYGEIINGRIGPMLCVD